MRCGTCAATLSGTSSLPPAAIAQAVPERREATLLFADLHGYTELTQRADVEEVAAIMDAVKTGAAEIVQAYGGVVNQFVGDEVMAVFGLPQGNEDDPRRAVSAALELHAFLRSPRLSRLLRRGRELWFHTGIDTGLVLAQSRDVRDGLFDLTGAAVNRAARLRALAARDEIVVSEDTRQRIAPFFQTEALAPRMLKGIDEAVTAHRVHAPGKARTAFDRAMQRGLTPYVARVSEIAALEECLADAGRGQARLVSVSGPPCVGKTRLVHELIGRAQSRGFTVLHGQCQSYGTIPPFQPFLETLKGAVGLGERGSADAAQRVVTRVLELDPALERHLPVYLYLLSLADAARPLPPELTGPALRRAVIAALGDILIAHARTRPVLVVVEDWHWADEASDALFRELARATSGQPIMALVTYRGEQLSEGRRPLSNRTVVLEPLREAGTAALVNELLQSQHLPEGLCRYVHEITDGNPFFIEEVCHMLVDAGALLRSAATWTLTRPLHELRAPANVQAMVRARIDRLQFSDKELLKLASVIGIEFALELLQPLCGQRPELEPSLSRLEQHAHVLQTAPERYRFKHPIVHEVVYNVLLLQRRRELHALIARTIEARHEPLGLQPHYEALAHHYAHSDRRELAIGYAELAAEKAERSFSLDQARRQYACAIECLDELEPTPERMHKRVDLSLRWASALVHNPAPGQLQVLQRSLEYATRLGYEKGAARCLCWMGWVEYTLGNQEQAVGYNQRCLSMRDAVAQPALIWQAQANIGMSYVMATRYDEAQSELERALVRLVDLDGPSAASGRGYALSHLALMAGDQGDFARARALLSDARAAIDESGRYQLLGAVATIEGMVSAFAADYEACGEAAARVREVAERIDGAYQRHMAAMLEGLHLWHGRADAHGIAMMRGAALALESRGIGLALSWCFAALAEALALRGEAAEAVTHADSALRRALTWDRLGEASALRARAIARAQHNDTRAGEDLAASLRVARAKQSPREQALCEGARVARAQA